MYDDDIMYFAMAKFKEMAVFFAIFIGNIYDHEHYFDSLVCHLCAK